MRRRIQDIVRISRHCSGETYNVDLLSAMGRGEYMGVGKEFDVSQSRSLRRALRIGCVDCMTRC